VILPPLVFPGLFNEISMVNVPQNLLIELDLPKVRMLCKIVIL